MHFVLENGTHNVHTISRFYRTIFLSVVSRSSVKTPRTLLNFIYRTLLKSKIRFIRCHVTLYFFVVLSVLIGCATCKYVIRNFYNNISPVPKALQIASFHNTHYLILYYKYRTNILKLFIYQSLLG